MWSEEAVGVFEYRDADAHCQGLKIAGFDDWRIPSITELELLLATEFSPAWRVEIGALWTSTQYNLREVQTIVFPDRSRSHQEVGMAHVLCVRSLD
jgi:hypothetical protein